MGLEGTLQLFSLNDLFQMLGLQRKSGLLTVEGDKDTVTISFVGGQVVAAESTAKLLDNRVGTLLVRAGRITQQQLERLLTVQSETRQRLGFLLIREGLVTPEDLREALRLQIFRIVFEAFRWTEGRFRFTPGASIDYDADHISPVATESVVLEVAQMTDEWPALLKIVGSPDVVFRRAAGVESLRLVFSPAEAGEGALLVSRPEAETWQLVDGNRSVAELLERAFLSDFDLYKGVSRLLGRNLIEEGKRTPAATAPVRSSAPAGPGRWTKALWFAVAALCGLSAFFVARGQDTRNLLLRPAGSGPGTADFLKAVSLERLVRIERAVRVYYDSTGQYPRRLEDLIRAGILSEEAIIDPYGRLYRYILRPEDGKFGLYGRNARGAIDLDLSFDRSLAPVAETQPAHSRVRQQEKKRGVQIVD